MTLGELIDRLNADYPSANKPVGQLVAGDPGQPIEGVNSVEQAGNRDLIFAENPVSAAEALGSRAGAVVLLHGCFQSAGAGKAVVESPQPRLWFACAARLLTPTRPATGVHPAAVVASSAIFGGRVSIGPGAVIGEKAHIGAGSRIEAGAVLGEGVRIGEECHVHPRAVLYSGVTLGNRVRIHAGAVLGADGFGYVRDTATGAYTQFPQQGTLVIEDDVEIGANSTIDRGALQETRIRRGVKIDNLVHVGHNCDIGEDVILVALTGISGSSTVGRGAVIAGQVGIGDHAHVGPGVILGGQAGVLSGKTVTNQGLKPGTVLWGTPARPLRRVLRELAVVARLARNSRRTEDKQ
jgi:UDP-3-O-[3-hydroxymyristoyl] glucosamine N-acyltransferase